MAEISRLPFCIIACVLFKLFHTFGKGSFPVYIGEKFFVSYCLRSGGSIAQTCFGKRMKKREKLFFWRSQDPFFAEWRMTSIIEAARMSR